MARRNDHSREELTRLTLDTVKLFLDKHPLEELSLRKIAADIGYVPSTLINLFGSLGGLLLAANAETLDELHRLSTIAVKNEKNPRMALLKLARITLAFARRHPQRWQMVFTRKATGQGETPDWYQMRINRLFALLTEQLSRLGSVKNLQKLHLASRVLWAGIHGICLQEVEDRLFTDNITTGEQMLGSLLENYLDHWAKSVQTKSAVAPA